MKKLVLLAALLSGSAFAQEHEAEARKIADTYLAALTGQGSDAGKQYLLGGLTMDASLYTVENAKISKLDYAKHETKNLKPAMAEMKDLDETGKKNLEKIGGAGSDDMVVNEISKEQAAKILGPTRAKAAKFTKDFPVLAYAARTEKSVYWHPKNPIRPLLAKSSGTGTYDLEVFHYTVESKEGPSKTSRMWPLRVIRFKNGALDTGWKILPASDWSVD